MSLRSTTALAAALMLGACSTTGSGFFSAPSLFSSTSETAPQKAHWLKDGSVMVARTVPEATIGTPPSMLGFLPVPASYSGSWLRIDRKNETIALMENSEQVSVMKAEGIGALQPALYHVMHKQRDALWYAPDKYFTERGLPVPPQGDKERYRRGALGDFAIFLDEQTPIHCGPLNLPEIGGVRVDEMDLSKLYYQLDIGTSIEVR